MSLAPPGDELSDAKSAVMAVASGVADWSMNGADVAGVPPADQGSTRYSAVSAAVFAANVTQPESVAGSMEL